MSLKEWWWLVFLAPPGCRGREIRSNSLGPTTSPSSNLLAVPGPAQRKTNLSRQISLSDSGEAIFSRQVLTSVWLIIDVDHCRTATNAPPGARHIGSLKSLTITYNAIPTTLIEEKEETSTNLWITINYLYLLSISSLWQSKIPFYSHCRWENSE